MTIDKAAVASALRSALAWGRTYADAIPPHQWDEMRERQIEQHLKALFAEPAWIPFQDQLPARYQEVFFARHGTTYTGTFELEPQMHILCRSHGMRYWLASERLDGWLPCQPWPVAPKSKLAPDPANRP